MRWLVSLVPVVLTGCNWVFGLDAPRGGDGAADGPAPGDGGNERAEQVVAGTNHTCVRRGTKARCWGSGASGQLGLDDTADVGDNEPASAGGDVALDRPVVSLAAGGDHTCAMTEGGDVSCWGTGARGQLGYGNTLSIGDDEPPSAAGAVPLGVAVSSITAGSSHTCAVTLGAQLSCWGAGGEGRLGYGNLNDVGDNEPPSAAGTVMGPLATIHASAGGQHTCAVDGNNAVSCWGSGANGRLGYGNINTIGDTEPPAAAGVISVGAQARRVVAGDRHSCALLVNGDVRCWGFGGDGRLGSGNEDDIGDGESPASVPPVDIGGSVIQLAAGGAHTCALIEGGAVRCWGSGARGQLGHGDQENIGDNESPAVAGDVPLGAAATAIAAGGDHTCALLDSGDVMCWGSGSNGQLGYGNQNDIGDNETPASAGPVPL